MKKATVIFLYSALMTVSPLLAEDDGHGHDDGHGQRRGGRRRRTNSSRSNASTTSCTTPAKSAATNSGS